MVGLAQKAAGIIQAQSLNVLLPRLPRDGAEMGREAFRADAQPGRHRLDCFGFVKTAAELIHIVLHMGNEFDLAGPHAGCLFSKSGLAPQLAEQKQTLRDDDSFRAGSGLGLLEENGTKVGCDLISQGAVPVD